MKILSYVDHRLECSNNIQTFDDENDDDWSFIFSYISIVYDLLNLRKGILNTRRRKKKEHKELTNNK